MGVKIPAAFEDATGKITRLTGEIEFLAPATPGEVLTVNNPATTAAFAAGGGGSGGVQVVTVPISSAEIKALANAPVVLIPGIAGNVSVVTGVGIVYVAGATPYTDHGGNINVDTVGSGASWISQTSAGFWDQATNQVAYYGFTTNGSDALSVFDGADVVLTDDGTNPTLGNGTLLVTVAYFLAPTA